MSESEKKIFLIVFIIIGAFLALIISGITLMNYFSEKSLDPFLEESVRSEYSVPVDVRIINTSEGNVAFIIPGEVKWDSQHKKLIYNLSDPKEATLAIVETLAKRDAQAFGFLLSNNTRESFNGYDDKQILDGLRDNYRDIEKPYTFGFGVETDLSMEMASVLIKHASDEIEFEMKIENGTWKI
jgi:hypothetical protein